MVHTLLQGEGGKLLSDAEAKAKINQLSENDFDIFADRAIFKPRLKHIADKLKVGEGALQKEVMGHVDNSLKRVREQQIEMLEWAARLANTGQRNGKTSYDGDRMGSGEKM